MADKSKYDLLDLALTEKRIDSPVRSYRAELEWREGMPYLISAPVVLSENPESSLLELMKKVLDLPYSGTNPQLAGLSVGESMIVSMGLQAADGNVSARTEILDRLLGKPQQNIKSVSLTGNLNDFLDSVAKSEKIQTVDVEVEPESVHTDVEDL